jgi:heme-degrading monooxygenase HmoA
MFAVIFELLPKQVQSDEYLRLAKYLRPKLDAIDGFIDIDRFASRRAWRGADAAKSWSPTRLDAATLVRHRHVRIIRDYGMFDRREAPQFFPEVNRVRRETGTLVAAEDTTAKRGRT